MEPVQQPAVTQPTPVSSNKPSKVFYVLLGLLLVVALGLGLWGYSQYNTQKDLNNKILELEASLDASQTDGEDGGDSSGTADESFLKIEQWGVKLKATDSPMLYFLTDQDGVEIAYLTNEKAQSLDSACKASSKAPMNGYLATLVRYKEVQSENTLPGDYRGEINGYHYYVGGSQNMCSQTLENQKIETQQRTALMNAAKSVTALE